ncbi:hypothetical protein PCI56_05010 [Plesiomonas shigelloides subsp. oncorhynchi]|nr:hypothetical protein [Plesiomonas shigelloides]
MEQKRADELAYKLATGQAEDNDWNRRMAEPQFRIISEEALVHIDFMWAFHHFNDKPFHALEIYHRVWSMGSWICWRTSRSAKSFLSHQFKAIVVEGWTLGRWFAF